MLQEVLVDAAFTTEGQPNGNSVIILDPYTGCQLQCPYCFQMNDPAWSRTISININIAGQLQKQLPDIGGEDIYFGSKCDPYMPAEEQYHLTRQCLQVLCHAKNHVFITTKADNGLILQDMALLRSFVTPPTVLMGLAHINQAHKGRDNQNIHIANTLKANGIDVWCFATPVLPCIMDMDAIAAALNPTIPIHVDKLRVMTDGGQDKKLLGWVDRHFPQYHDAYVKMLYHGDITYYQTLYDQYKADPRFVFMTDEWGV